MNGETYQLCRLVTEVKMALKEKRDLIYMPEPENFLKIIEFHFMTENTTKANMPEVVYDPIVWYEKLREQGLADIKLILPTNVEDFNLLGFSNTNRGSMVTFLKGGKVRYWIADWKYETELKKWRVTYKEYEWKDAPDNRPSYADNTTEFVDVLDRISVFADKIGYKNFGDIFRESAAIVRGEKEEVLNERQKEIPRPVFPITHKPIFAAAAKADVFGAMGSWNDSPEWSAHNMGLIDEYKSLSSELLAQIRRATMYAVNEW